MKLTQPLANVYCKEQKTALEAQRLAQEIVFAPMVFQVSRLMVKFGILEFLSNNHKGVTQAAVFPWFSAVFPAFTISYMMCITVF